MGANDHLSLSFLMLVIKFSVDSYAIILSPTVTRSDSLLYLALSFSLFIYLWLVICCISDFPWECSFEHNKTSMFYTPAINSIKWKIPSARNGDDEVNGCCVANANWLFWLAIEPGQTYVLDKYVTLIVICVSIISPSPIILIISKTKTKKQQQIDINLQVFSVDITRKIESI